MVLFHTWLKPPHLCLSAVCLKVCVTVEVLYLKPMKKRTYIDWWYRECFCPDSKLLFFCFQGIAGKSGPRGQRGPTVSNLSIKCQHRPSRLHKLIILFIWKCLPFCNYVWDLFFSLLKKLGTGWGILELETEGSLILYPLYNYFVFIVFYI